MLQSELFGKTLRENPKDEISKNAILLERGGFIYKTLAGVYDFLPLGVRVIEKIKTIIREEINMIGGQEVILTSLQPKERWTKTGRWNDLGREIMYQFKDRSGREIGLASTHEEALTEIAKRNQYSYKDLPFFIYQIQTKFRDELRAKSGLIRGKEFLMKDLYSFHADKKDLEKFYFKTIDKAYKNIFKRCGLKVCVAEASGGDFTKEYTHEYQVFSNAGEDQILYCKKCDFAQNKEIASAQDSDKCPKCGGLIEIKKSIEVGNIFRLGTRYSEAIGLYYLDKKGDKKPIVMGSYGIGIPRVMATVVEIHHDDNGIIWPADIAPFQAHLISLNKGGKKDNKIIKEADKLYKNLLAENVEVLYDDRDDKTPGEKFADSDLIGIPFRIVISEKTVAKKAVELKIRSSGHMSFITPNGIHKKLKIQNEKIKMANQN